MTSLKELLKRECSYEPADATLDRFLVLAHTINLAQDEVLIHPGQNNSNVYVVKDGKAEDRKVELGQRLDKEYEIISGINPGETVVVAGHTKLKNGSIVSIVSKK